MRPTAGASIISVNWATAPGPTTQRLPGWLAPPRRLSERRADREVEVPAPPILGRHRAERPALGQRLEHILGRAEIQGGGIELIPHRELNRSDHGLITQTRPHR